MEAHLTHDDGNLTAHSLAAHSYTLADIDNALVQAQHMQAQHMQAQYQTVNKLTLYPSHTNTLPDREQVTMTAQQGNGVNGVTISLTIGDTTTSATFKVTRPDHATALHDLGQHIANTAGMIETEWLDTLLGPDRLK